MITPTMTARAVMTGTGPLYLASVVGGPCDVVARSTEAAALAAGAAYVADRWGRRADGTWSPYPEQWERP